VDASGLLLVFAFVSAQWPLIVFLNLEEWLLEAEQFPFHIVSL
jgi:hypothetical protein